jgi:TIR domain/Sel1 repeat
MSAFTTDCLRSAPDWGDGKVAVTIGVPAAFFSYSREDSEFVLRVAGDLKAAGANVWLDQIDILPGQRWDDAIARALDDCPRVLVVLSPASVHSTNVMDEVSFALEKGKTVIPILHRECEIPFRLRRVQYIDLRHDYPRGLAELLKILVVQRADAGGTIRAADSRKEDSEVPGTAARVGPVEPEAPQKDREAAGPVQEPIPDEPTGKDGGGVVPRRSMKTKAAVTACGVLVGISVLYWGLRHADQKGNVSPVVESAPSKVAPPIQPPPIQPKGDSETTGPPPESPKAADAPRIKPRPSARTPEIRNSRAMVELGMDYVRGRGVLQDYQKAASWLRKASEAGDPTGMNNLGVLYANGNGVPKDYQQAATWYRKAADAGYAPAMANLGSLYEKGNGVPKDSLKAVDWYRKAAQAGNTSAMYDLGAMYENGEGVVKDRQQAVDWYRKAADRGEQHAEQALRRLGLTQ